jgi:hypothetical protein
VVRPRRGLIVALLGLADLDAIRDFLPGSVGRTRRERRGSALRCGRRRRRIGYAVGLGALGYLRVRERHHLTIGQRDTLGRHGRAVRKGEELELHVDSLAYGGNGVARLNGFVVFVRVACRAIECARV